MEVSQEMGCPKCLVGTMGPYCVNCGSKAVPWRVQCPKCGDRWCALYYNFCEECGANLKEIE